MNLAISVGATWILGKSDEQKEAYGRGLFALILYDMPAWMQAISKHKADAGDDHDAAVGFLQKHGEILPPDAEKLCVFWDLLAVGYPADDLIDAYMSLMTEEEPADDDKLAALEGM